MTQIAFKYILQLFFNSCCRDQDKLSFHVRISACFGGLLDGTAIVDQTVRPRGRKGPQLRARFRHVFGGSSTAQPSQALLVRLCTLCSETRACLEKKKCTRSGDCSDQGKLSSRVRISACFGGSSTAQPSQALLARLCALRSVTRTCLEAQEGTSSGACRGDLETGYNRCTAPGAEKGTHAALLCMVCCDADLKWLALFVVVCSVSSSLVQHQEITKMQ